MASRPFQFLEKERSKIRKRAAKHFEGLAALSTHSAGRRAAVKTGCKPVHFSLDGCPLSCYFSGSVATTSGHFIHKSERRTKNGGVHIRPVCCRKQTCACGSTPHKHSPVFLPPLPGGNGIFTATPTERITHYTLLRKVVCQMGALPPLETPTSLFAISSCVRFCFFLYVRITSPICIKKNLLALILHRPLLITSYQSRRLLTTEYNLISGYK